MYENFIASVEAKKLLTERDENLILGRHCTREYEGEIKKLGDEVIIKGLGDPTIYKASKDTKYTAGQIGPGSIAGTGKDIVQRGIPDAEELDGYEIKLPINQIAIFNFMVGDIDKQQSSEKGLLAKSRARAARKMAYQQDEHIRDVIIGNKNCILRGSDFQTNGVANLVKISALDSPGDGYINVLDAVDEFIQQLKQNKIKDVEHLVAECSFGFMRRLKKAMRYIDTDNTELVRGRKVPSYNGLKFFESNVMSDENADYLFIRTLDSTAFVDPLSEIEPYRPQSGFGDALKGYDLYDSKVIDTKACKFIKIDRAYEG